MQQGEKTELNSVGGCSITFISPGVWGGFRTSRVLGNLPGTREVQKSTLLRVRGTAGGILLPNPNFELSHPKSGAYAICIP